MIKSRRFQIACVLKKENYFFVLCRNIFDIPFAFADIEMVFDGECRAIDWVFRYGNPALAQLEKMPLEKLIGNSFGNLFPNMDTKWLRSYERATLFGETLQIIDHSPDIDAYL